MSKTLTDREAMQALLDGKKLTRKGWAGDRFNYLELNDKGTLVDRFEIGRDLDGCFDYEIYEEPKPKKQVWQWRYKHKPGLGYLLGNRLLTEQEAKKEYAYDHSYEKHAGPFEVDAEESIRATSAFTQASARVEE